MQEKPYDLVNAAEASHNKTIIHASVELGSQGAIQIVGMPAKPLEEIATAVEKK